MTKTPQVTPTWNTGIATDRAVVEPNADRTEAERVRAYLDMPWADPYVDDYRDDCLTPAAHQEMLGIIRCTRSDLDDALEAIIDEMDAEAAKY